MNADNAETPSKPKAVKTPRTTAVIPAKRAGRPRALMASITPTITATIAAVSIIPSKYSRVPNGMIGLHNMPGAGANNKKRSGIKELRAKGVFSKKRFYRRISERANYVDDETIAMVYQAIIKIVIEDIKEYGVGRLPHLGDFLLTRERPRLGLMGKFNKVKVLVPPIRSLKFYPVESLQRYISKWQRDKQEHDGMTI